MQQMIHERSAKKSVPMGFIGRSSSRLAQIQNGGALKNDVHEQKALINKIIEELQRVGELLKSNPTEELFAAFSDLQDKWNCAVNELKVMGKHSSNTLKKQPSQSKTRITDISPLVMLQNHVAQLKEQTRRDPENAEATRAYLRESERLQRALERERRIG